MMDWHIETADVMDWAARYDGPKFHALLCDPPYHLGPNGFMGKSWDAAKYGIAFKPDTWAALAEHLLPGAFGMAFASSRGWHRLAVAIEDAGLRIHPSIFGWCYGSGFPKATRIDTQVDKAAGAERETIGEYDSRSKYDGCQRNSAGVYTGGITNEKTFGAKCSTVPATPLAQSWQGHRYGLQAMKPALEPIIVFQKPYAGKPVESITETGAGSLWIDGSRIGTDDSLMGGQYSGNERQDGVCYGKHRNLSPEEYQHPQGRWPANFTLTHAPECVRIGEKRVRGTGIAIKRNKSDDQFERNEVYGKYHQLPSDNVTYAAPDGLETIAAWDCVPECPVRRLGEQSGERASCGEYTKSLSKPEILNYGLMFANPDISSTRKEKNRYSGDKGTAARFFHQSDWSYEIAERLAQADPVRYVAKASRKERDAGLERFPVQELQTHGEMRPDTTGKSHNTTGQRSARARNFHPTIKPIALTRWLATLLLPPAEYAPRRLMVPFAGTGSEMIGGGGWEYILGIEMDADTVDIASARLEHWLEQSRQLELIR